MIRITLGLLAAGLGLGIVAAACGTTAIKTETVTETTTAPASTQPAEENPPAATPQKAKVGSTIALTGLDNLEMNVKVLAYLDPASGGPYDEPAPGNRFVGVQVQLTNTGQVAYSDSPSNEGVLITNTNQEADSAITVGGSCESPDHQNIAPGGTRVVCLPFEINKTQQGAIFQYTLDSGAADDTGEWTLDTATSTAGSPPTGPPPLTSLSDCGGGVEALAATTSCQFAQNVFYAFYKASPQREFPVYSPVTRMTYQMSCTDESTVICTGGKNAEVRFPMSAVQAYTESDARAYASSHDLGP